LNLIVGKFIKSPSVKPVIENGHKWATLLHKSGPAMKLYEHIQGEEEGNSKRKIPTVSFILKHSLTLLGCLYSLEF